MAGFKLALSSPGPVHVCPLEPVFDFNLKHKIMFVIEKGLDCSHFKTDTHSYLRLLLICDLTNTLRFSFCSPVRLRDSVSLDMMMFIIISLYLISAVKVSLELNQFKYGP